MLAQKYGIIKKVSKNHVNVRNIYTSEKFTIKPINKSRSSIRLIEDTITTYRDLDHRNIARLIEIDEDDSSYYLVKEMCDGAPLSEALRYESLYDGVITNTEMFYSIMSDIIEGVNHMHKKNMTMGQVTTDNLIFSTKDCCYKFIDIAPTNKVTQKDDVLHVGIIAKSMYQVCPELQNNKYLHDFVSGCSEQDPIKRMNPSQMYTSWKFIKSVFHQN